ncbi:MAG: hypothetical protein A2X86_07005 [Bdellovibrionales bacterium GWA2_49_15]|nr:MAG: hypothetical protein A2X86_07005 [Bdellovibrionales bacterium GWA2_49_15]HAZ11976.1 hypothetical protein [Bdellovibrionales bacterium]
MRRIEAAPLVEKGELNVSRLSLLERLTKEAQTSHEQNVEALNLVAQESTTAAEITLRSHFKLAKKKRVITIELDDGGAEAPSDVSP